MIDVQNLSKSYSGHRAVQNLTFDVKRKEIVGLLGPNGAGKSTTMRILSGYLPPTDGKVTIAGFDVVTQSLEVRKRIGYMPEKVPMYPDMRVHEFLRFRAELKKVPSRNIRNRVDAVNQLCQLGDLRRSIIGTLSKGQQQRVALADSLIHEPELLILDEPTAGFDPTQIRAARELVKELSKHHTILLSTHILSEVEMLCNRVIIINRGRIEKADTPSNLTRMVRGGHYLKVEIKAPSDKIISVLEAVKDVEDVESIAHEDGWCIGRVYSAPGTDVRDSIYSAILKQGWPLREMTVVRATLEEAFVELTQD
ncbi:MAG: ABC transporter ATP-binding protein [Candidatus Methylacidiphilales bacterium]|nr:ABC transporter ATP-binding protein [Candidatus Methylacidiphilales bacterium]